MGLHHDMTRESTEGLASQQPSPSGTELGSSRTELHRGQSPNIRYPNLHGVLRFPIFVYFAFALMVASWHNGDTAWLIPSAHALAVPSVFDGALAQRADAVAAPAASPSVLEVIEVYPPVRFEQGQIDFESPWSEQQPSSSCQQTLVVHSFGNSYGTPYIGPYTPPSCNFNRVVWNLTVTAAGRQFDRLGTVSLGDIEVFRTSTAEPTQNGIVWNYVKDMSSYTTLFKKDQTIICDLGNIVNNIYTAAYNVTLTATYYNVISYTRAADTILPLSRGFTNASSAFTFPQQNVTSSFVIPRNSARAVFTIAATGQIGEEFWWGNVLQQDVDDFPAAGPLAGYSPFREVQLFIDGQLAGVAWPFPIIFTGGIVPGLWRPIVGIDAFDLQEDEIDVTPWLPLLTDGKPHEYSIKVSGLQLNADGTTVLSETVGDYWVITGKLFIWEDPFVQQVSGSTPKLNFPQPQITATSQFQNNSNPNDTVLNYQVNVARQLTVSGSINGPFGVQQVSWQQSLTYSSVGEYSQEGNQEFNALTISGHDSSSSGYQRRISYPLNVTSLFTTNGDNETISAVLTRGRTVETYGQPVFPTGLESFKGTTPFNGALLTTTQNGQATYEANTTAQTAISYGQTSQDLTFSSLSPLQYFDPNPTGNTLYHRSVSAVNGTIVSDQIIDEGQNVPGGGSYASPENTHGYALVKFGKAKPLGIPA